MQGGNSFGATATLGTNDNFPPVLETNNTERLRITENGFIGIGTNNPQAEVHMVGGSFIFESLGDFVLKSPINDGSINLHFSGGAAIEYGFGTEPGLVLDVGLGSIFLSDIDGNISIGENNTRPQATLQVMREHSSSILMIGSSTENGSLQRPGCLVIGDSDGTGVTYVTANDGVLTASTTKPGICE